MNGPSPAELKFKENTAKYRVVNRDLTENEEMIVGWLRVVNRDLTENEEMIVAVNAI